MSSENNAVNATDVLRDPSEMTEQEIRAERAKLDLIKSRLELAKLRRDNKVALDKELELAQRAANEGKNFEELRRRDELIQSRCNHRKGGMDNRASQKQGDSNFYSVVHHSGTFGGTIVLCTRCNKLWLANDPQHGGKATPGYNEALRFPTDNQPSSSVVFQAQQMYVSNEAAA